MEKELADMFSQVVERYRLALLQHARKCDWETFKTKAGSLFDYVEKIEMSEIEDRFFRIFKSILAVLVAVVLAIANMDASIHPDLGRVKYAIIVMAAAGSCFELCFFLNFRTYMIGKTRYYKKRKDRFIRNIEKDFREMIRQCAG
jgi:hypothetical protein